MHEVAGGQQSQDEASQAKDFLNNVIDSSPDSIIIGDSSGRVTRVNKAFLNLIKSAPEAVIGKTPAAFAFMDKGVYATTAGEKIEITDQYFAEAYAITARLFEEGSISNWIAYVLRSDGKLVPIEQNIVLLRNEAGQRIGAVSFLRDITKRHKAEAALRRSEERYYKLIENANDAIVSGNANALIIGFNKKAEEMFGYFADEIIGKSSMLLVPPDLRSRQQKAFEAFMQSLRDSGLQGFSGKIIEGIGCRKGGSLFPTESSYYVLEVQGELIITALIRDVSERKEFQKKLIQNEKLRSLGEMASGVAHDFNNILAAILGRVQLLSRKLLPPPDAQEKRRANIMLREGLGIIEKAALDGAETVRRIQEFARHRDNEYFAVLDINTIVQDALQFTKTKWKDEAESKGIRIHIKKKFTAIPPVAGSPSELRELFTNLINNAVDAMTSGGELSIKTFVSDDGSSAVIAIKDTGAGIPHDILERVFEPFFTTKGVHSSGLGLSVSYGIVNRHRGDIKIKSTEGQGTVFTVSIPLHHAATDEKSGRQPSEAAAKQVQASVLVIEDEPEVRAMLSDVLTDHGHHVESASNGEQGVAAFKEKQFDLVFTDLGMPGMSGWQVAREIKNINQAVPIVLITGWAVELEADDMRRRDIEAVLNKPFNIYQLLQLIEKLAGPKEKQ